VTVWRYPQSVDELLEEGLEAYGRGKEDRAVELWNEALRIDPTNALAREYLEAAGIEPPKQAGADGSPAPDYSTALRAGTTAYLRRDYDEAERCFRRCLDLRPGDPRALHNLKRLALRKAGR